MRHISHYTPFDRPELSRQARASTNSSSASKSETPNSACPPPMISTGSGGAKSVHSRGTAQMSPSTSSNTLAPRPFALSPTQCPHRPDSGWKGCVTWTRFVAVTATRAVWIVAQAFGRWALQFAQVRRRQNRVGPPRAARRVVGHKTTTLLPAFFSLKTLVSEVKTPRLHANVST